MSQVISWIAAVAESGEESEFVPLDEEPSHDEPSGAGDQNPAFEDPLDRNPDLRAYRGRTVSLLRLYFRYAMEAGRLPSLMGSEFFRTRVTCYSVVTFEDRVVFVHDMEVCLEKLNELSRQVIVRYILQGFDRREAARLIRCNEKTVRRHVPVALDELSEILLAVGVLKDLGSE